MKVFISHSGKVSHEIACIFRDWLPSVIQSIKPYVSSEDIDKGRRWSIDIAGELKDSNYGVCIVTKENVHAPWLNFEAGALSKIVNKANVSPFLFDIKGSEIPNNHPLTQFQFTIFEKKDIRKLIHSINNQLDEENKLNDSRINKSFERWWSDLETKLTELKKRNANYIGKIEKDEQPNILEEILELVRNQQRILNSPEKLLPDKHFEKVLSIFHEKDIYFISKLVREHHELWKLANKIKKELEEAIISNKEYSSDNFNSDIEILLVTVNSLGEELREFEKQKFGKMRARMIIPEF